MSALENPAPVPRWRLLVLTIVVVGMHAVAIWAAISNRSYLIDDSIQYLTIAENWASGKGFSQSFAAPYVPDTQRTPGYPTLIVILGQDPITVIFAQHMLVFGAGVLLFFLLRDHYGERLARTGAWFYLLQPYPIVMASFVLSETLFIFLLLTAVLGYLRFWRGRGGQWLMLGLGMLAVAALVRPVALPLVYLATFAACLRAWRLAQHRIAQLVLAVLVPLAVLAPWYVRNHSIEGRWEFSTMGEMGMLHGRLGALESWRSGAPMDEHHYYMAGDSVVAMETGLLPLRTYPEDKQTHETERLQQGMTGQTIRFFLAHPLDAIRFQLRNTWEMLKGAGYGWTLELTHNRAIAATEFGWQLILNMTMYLGFLLALVRMREWKYQEWLTLGAVSLLFLVSSAGWADGRYRMVLDPLLVLFLVFILHRQALLDQQA